MNFTEFKDARISITCADGEIRSADELKLGLTECHGGELISVSGIITDSLASKESIVINTGIRGEGRFVAIASHSPFWCKPFFGSKLSEIPTLTAELFFFDGNVWHCLLPLVKGDFKAYLDGDEGGLKVVLYTNCRGEYSCTDQPCFLYFKGEDPEVLSRQAAEGAREVLGVKLRAERPYPEALEYLGWCSWDAMGIRVSHEGLVSKAREFSEKGVPVGFAVIDDMWADVPALKEIPEDAEYFDMCNAMHESAMRTFSGDSVRFPNGMAAAVRDIKSIGIKSVAIWFPTTGYWAGFTPDGEDAKALSDCLMRTDKALWGNEIEKKGQLLPKPQRDTAGRYFDELCSRAKSWGADFVKIDNQGCHSYYEDFYPIGRSAANMQEAIDAAAFKYFDGGLINCMGMPTECMFQRPNSAISRCSDDFIPESRAWFSKNILQCSYNGLLQGRFYTNDWDMWWTDDSSATKNSLCRAISGGPIYVSDKIGRTRAELLAPLCLSDGRILRADESATPTADCMLSDPTEAKKPFKIKNRMSGVGLVAAFNINKDGVEVTGSVSPSDAGIKSAECAYFEHFSGECGFVGADEAIPVTLDEDDIMLWSFYEKKSIVPLGRIDMFMGMGAIRENGDGSITLLEGGEIGFISEESIRVWVNGDEIATERCGLLTKATCRGKNLTIRCEIRKGAEK